MKTVIEKKGKDLTKDDKVKIWANKPFVTLGDRLGYYHRYRANCTFLVLVEPSHSPEDKWISVEDRMPDPDTNVIAWCKEWEEPRKMSYYEIKKEGESYYYWYPLDSDDQCINTPLIYGEDSIPTHWSPLLTPPKQ